MWIANTAASMVVLQQSLNGSDVTLLFEKFQTNGCLSFPFGSGKENRSMHEPTSANRSRVPSVLIPGFHLGVGETQTGR
jgi:hypothetical protein